MNLFAVGFPVTLMMGFMLMWVTLPQVMGNFYALINEAFAFSSNVLAGG